MQQRLSSLLALAPVTVALIALVLARAVDQTLYYRLANAVENYVWYIGALVLPIAFLAISVPVVIYKIYMTNDITPEMRAFPMKRFALMGLLDTAYNLLSSWPINGIGGTTANVLSQAALPMNMLLAAWFIGTRYTRTHYVGAALVLYGILVQQIPALQGDDTGGDASGITYVLWFVMMLASALPNAASNVYKEIGLQAADLDIWYANVWIGVWQLIFGILTAPTVGLPFTPDHVKLSDLPKYLDHANSCFFGGNPTPEDHCREYGLPLVIFAFFIVFNITYNMLMLSVFKNASSVLFVLASAVRLPLVQLLLMWKFVAGGATQTFTLHDGFALFALVLGVCVYYSTPEIKPDHKRAVSTAGGMASLVDEETGMYASLVKESPRVGTELRTSVGSASAERQTLLNRRHSQE